MIHAVNNLMHGYYGLDKVQEDKSKDNAHQWKVNKSSEQEQPENSGGSQSEIVEVEGQKVLVISNGKFKMRINLGPVNLPNGKDKADAKPEDKESAPETSALSARENQYLQNDAIASGLSSGITFNTGI